MTEKEKIALLEECMYIDEGTLQLNDELASYSEWDSLSILEFVAEVDERFGKTIDMEIIKDLVTVEDVIKLIG